MFEATHSLKNKLERDRLIKFSCQLSINYLFLINGDKSDLYDPTIQPLNVNSSDSNYHEVQVGFLAPTLMDSFNWKKVT